MSNKCNSGASAGDILTIMFIGLKITDQIDWPWTLVLSPIWIGVLISFIIISFVKK
jgi:hypothetical protein